MELFGLVSVKLHSLWQIPYARGGTLLIEALFVPVAAEPVQEIGGIRADHVDGISGELFHVRDAVAELDLIDPIEGNCFGCCIGNCDRHCRNHCSNRCYSWRFYCFYQLRDCFARALSISMRG